LLHHCNGFDKIYANSNYVELVDLFNKIVSFCKNIPINRKYVLKTTRFIGVKQTALSLKGMMGVGDHFDDVRTF
jgi:hypothetical protein